jgi:thiamine biosynthesis lipoprotein
LKPPAKGRILIVRPGDFQFPVSNFERSHMADRSSGRTLWYALALCLLAFALVTIARRPPANPVSISETRSMLGTYVTLTVVAESESKARADIAAGFERIAELDAIMSAHRTDSELARLNERAGREPVKVSDELYRAIEAGVTWNGRTQGAFDIACAPLLELWRHCGKLDRPPTPDELARAKSLGGAARILLDPKAHTVRFPIAGMRLDLGGHGKGFIADEVEKVFLKRGVKNALIALSGDIRAMGCSAEGRPWRVGVQDPRNPEAIITTLALTDRSVSTSGAYERFVVIQGKRHSHIVDPRTGQTAEGVLSDTVIGPDTTTTDVLDTGLNVLGVKDGLALVEKLKDVEALFVTGDEKGEMRLTRSAGFAAYERSAK